MKDIADTGVSRRKVMLICEDGGLGLAVERMLAADGRSLTRRECVAEAIASIRDEAPDVVVLEARVRNAEALGLCQSLRADPGLRQVRLLMLQDAGRPIDRRRAAALGADGVLAMPFAMADLRREVDRLLDAT